MSRRGTDHLTREIQNLIDRHCREYKMTGCEIVGCLEFVKQDIMLQTFEVLTASDIEDDDDGELQPADPIT